MPDPGRAHDARRAQRAHGIRADNMSNADRHIVRSFTARSVEKPLGTAPTTCRTRQSDAVSGLPGGVQNDRERLWCKASPVTHEV